jgi:hypothetical protein
MITIRYPWQTHLLLRKIVTIAVHAEGKHPWVIVEDGGASIAL